MRRGFTLVETLLSFTLTAIMLVLILNIFPTSMASVHQAEQRQLAASMAMSVLEQRVQQPFNALQVGLTAESGPQTVDSVEYRTHFTVSKVPDRDENFLRALKVTVTWKYQGRELHLSREIYVHRLASQKP
jgi:type II secretory pathway pseudopilin PulG